MDMIPTDSPNRTPLEVPYHIDKSQSYVIDNGPFAGFPQRMGWDTTKELYVYSEQRQAGLGSREDTTTRRGLDTSVAVLGNHLPHYARAGEDARVYIAKCQRPANCDSEVVIGRD